MGKIQEKIADHLAMAQTHERNIASLQVQIDELEVETKEQRVAADKRYATIGEEIETIPPEERTLQQSCLLYHGSGWNKYYNYLSNLQRIIDANRGQMILVRASPEHSAYGGIHVHGDIILSESRVSIPTAEYSCCRSDYFYDKVYDNYLGIGVGNSGFFSIDEFAPVDDYSVSGNNLCIIVGVDNIYRTFVNRKAGLLDMINLYTACRKFGFEPPHNDGMLRIEHNFVKSALLDLANMFKEKEMFEMIYKVVVLNEEGKLGLIPFQEVPELPSVSFNQRGSVTEANKCLDVLEMCKVHHPVLLALREALSIDVTA